MRKFTWFVALCVLVFAAGCQSKGKLVFTNDKKIYQINEDSTDLAGPRVPTFLPPLPLPDWDKCQFPEVSHDGQRVLFVLNSTGGAYGALFSMPVGGTDAKRITPDDSVCTKPRWVPYQNAVAYYGRNPNPPFKYGVYEVSTDGPPAVGTRICSNEYNAFDGFDINKPSAGVRQIIYSEPVGFTQKLHRVNAPFPVDAANPCGSPVAIPPYPPQGYTYPAGDPSSHVYETLPVVSIGQDILINAIKWVSLDGSDISYNYGLRMRSITANGGIGIPLTLKLKLPEGFNIRRITGLSLAGNSNAIYFSAVVDPPPPGGDGSEIYVISVMEYLGTLIQMVSLPPEGPLVYNVTPTQLTIAGAREKRWPSGIRE